jgi:hypothetical protein
MGRCIFSSRDLPPNDRLPESYVLVCPERSQVQYPSDTQCSLHDFFQSQVGDHAWFWNSFATPIQDAQRIQKFHPKVRRDGKRSLLESLPGELIDELIDRLLEPVAEETCTKLFTVSILALGLSSPILYPRVLSRIHKEYTEQAPESWAGKRVGFHGTESFIPDKHQMQYLNVSVSAYTSGIRWFSWPRANAEPEMFWHTAIASVHQTWPEIDEKSWQAISQDVSQIYMYPQNRTWVLRNLDTKQFVRSDNLTPPSKITLGKLHLRRPNQSPFKRLWNMVRPTRQPSQAPLTLAQIFIILTACTTTSNGHEIDHLFQNGPWTAHAFDLVTLEEHIASGEDGWSDVSPLAVADIGHLRWCVQQCMLWDEGRVTRKLDSATLIFYGRIQHQRRQWHSWT